MRDDDGLWAIDVVVEVGQGRSGIERYHFAVRQRFCLWLRVLYIDLFLLARMNYSLYLQCFFSKDARFRS